MRLVELRPEKKHLVALQTDTGERLLIDRDVCADHALQAGDELDDSKWEQLAYESNYQRAKNRALWYLDRADRTEQGLYRKLIEAGFEKQASAAVIARLKELGLLDDERFAENFVYRCCEANISRREAVRKMLEKGVPYAIAKEAAGHMEVDEEEQIRALIRQKYANRLSQEKGAQKVFAALARKGFSFGAIKAALRQYDEEIENSEEW
ncbi:MAG: regulatory protein RecX [Clostridia bacterium]|nr:regulatory protein RecX [Clostridia bacterium]